MLDNMVTFQIIRFLLGSHEGFSILQNNKANIVVIPHQVKSLLQPSAQRHLRAVCVLLLVMQGQGDTGHTSHYPGLPWKAA